MIVSKHRQTVFLSKCLSFLPNSLRSTLAVHLGKPDLRFSLLQLRTFGFSPRLALDVGAYTGDWAKTCLQVFPDVSVVCFEPQEAPQTALRSLADRCGQRVMVKQGLLGSEDSLGVPFSETGTGSSVYASPNETNTRPMWRIDTLVDAGFCHTPDFVKLDVQGYELEVLSGFEKHLASCQVLQLELSLLPIVPNAPLVDEVILYLRQRGFVLFDLDELIRAPSDGAVWQIDAMFCRKDAAIRRERRWR